MLSSYSSNMALSSGVKPAILAVSTQVRFIWTVMPMRGLSDLQSRDRRHSKVLDTMTECDLTGVELNIVS